MLGATPRTLTFPLRAVSSHCSVLRTTFFPDCTLSHLVHALWSPLSTRANPEWAFGTPREWGLCHAVDFCNVLQDLFFHLPRDGFLVFDRKVSTP